MGKLISYNDMSDLTGKSYRIIKRDLDLAGVKPVTKDGTKILFDSAIALKALFSEKSSEDIDLAALGPIELEKHRKIKRENDEAEKIVAPVSLLTEALSNVASQVVPILESLPLEMKRRNPGLSGHDVMLVKKEIAKCRNIIADVKIDI